MKLYLLCLGLAILLITCIQSSSKTLVDTEEVYAWCIIPYDSLDRTPVQRIAMLKGLGLNAYAYDWREKHLPSMAEELKLAEQSEVKVIAVWTWIDADSDSVGHLSSSNETVFDVVEEVGYTGEIWVGFAANFVAGLTDSAAISKGAAMVEYLSQRANALGCKLAIYNHGDWFGEPTNQVQIIKALPDAEIGLVYNFHHAHKQIAEFPALVDTMLPYLWHVNLNGLREEGPKILPVGEGDHEEDMITLLLNKGYEGDFGILGHVEDADAERILRQNLVGLESMVTD